MMESLYLQFHTLTSSAQLSWTIIFSMKLLNFFKCGYIFVVLTLIGVTQSLKLSGQPTKAGDRPVVTVEDWLESGETVWAAREDGMSIDPDILTVNQDSYIISRYVAGLVVSCQAPYPIEWVSEVGWMIPPQMLGLIQGKVVREVGNVFDSATFTYTSYLIFRSHMKEMTGAYWCRKVGDDLHSTHIYMFWEGLTPSLVLSSRSFKIKAPRHADELMLPCYPSSPNTTVYLYKAVSIDMFYTEVYYKVKDEYTQFDPTYGIFLDLKTWKDVPGKYKCSTNDTSDFVDIEITQGIVDDNKRHVDVIQRNASFTYNTKNHELMCCSSSGKTPRLNSIFCASPTMCSLLGDNKFNAEYQNMGVREFGTVNTSCVGTPLFPGSMGHFQCVGDDIDVIRTLYTTYPDQKGTFSIFTSWDSVKPAEMIHVSVQDNLVDVPWGWRRGRVRGGKRRPFPGRSGGQRLKYRPRRPRRPLRNNSMDIIPRTIYSGESITVSCIAPTSYFSNGAQFVIRWNNNTLEPIPTLQGRMARLGANSIQLENQGFIPAWRRYSHFSAISSATTQVSSNMSAIICYAPVYNSTAWIQKEIPVHAKEPTPPSFLSGEQDITLYWTLNDTDRELRCEGTGEPMPTVTLFLNNNPVTNSSHVTLIEQNATLIMRVPKVYHDFHGQYTCIAYNLGGTVEQKITIVVEEPRHDGWIIALGTGLGIGVLSGFGFLGWRFWKRRSGIV